MANLLEILNKIAIVPDLILVMLLAAYFIREAQRRNLRALDWLHLDEGMTFALSTMVLVFFLALRFIATVLWYNLGQKLLPVQMLFLIAILGIITGLTLMVRAITKPYHGNSMWLLTLAATISVAGALMFG